MQGNPKLPLRMGAAAFVVLVIAATFMGMRRGPELHIGESPTSETAAPADPMMAQLVRCSMLGEPALHDAACLAAWAEHRRRFLAPSTQRVDPAP